MHTLVGKCSPRRGGRRERICQADQPGGQQLPPLWAAFHHVPHVGGQSHRAVNRPQLQVSIVVTRSCGPLECASGRRPLHSQFWPIPRGGTHAAWCSYRPRCPDRSDVDQVFCRLHPEYWSYGQRERAAPASSVTRSVGLFERWRGALTGGSHQWQSHIRRQIFTVHLRSTSESTTASRREDLWTRR